MEWTDGKEFDLVDGTIPPLPENLKGEHVFLTHQVRIEPDGRIRHYWNGLTIGKGSVHTGIGEEQETSKAMLDFLSREKQERIEFEALPEDVKEEIRGINLANFIDALEAKGMKNAKKKVEGLLNVKLASRKVRPEVMRKVEQLAQTE